MYSNKKIRMIGILLLTALMLLPVISAYAAPSMYVKSIFVQQKPDKLVYDIGESVSLKGMIIGVRTSKSGKAAIQFRKATDIDDLEWSPKKFSGAGTKVVTVGFEAISASGEKKLFTTSFKVTVNEGGDAPTGWTNSIDVTTKPKKTEYTVGESFDPTGMVVTAKQTEAGKSVKTVLPESMYTYSPKTLNESGKIEIAIKAKLNDENGKTKTFSDTITVTVYGKIKIKKSPGGETVEEGGSCNFTVRADNYKSVEWFFKKGDSIVSANDAASTFKGLKISGTKEEKLRLSNIPSVMDGWKVYAVFRNPVDSKETKSCDLNVTEKKTESVTEKPTDTPQPTTTEHESMEVQPTPGEQTESVTTTVPVIITSEPKPTEHAHSFSSAYKSDAKQHWLECACGEKANIANHVVTNWTVVKRPTSKEDGLRTGVCVVCGHTVEETIGQDDPQNGGTNTTALWIAGGIGAAVLVTVPPLLIASMVLRSKEKKKKKDSED